MLPGLRLVLAAIIATVVIVVLGFAQLVKLQVAHSHSVIGPVEARFAGLAFAERADWMPAAASRQVSLESLAPFAVIPAGPVRRDAAEAYDADARPVPLPPAASARETTAPNAAEWATGGAAVAVATAEAPAVASEAAPPVVVASLQDGSVISAEALAAPEAALPDETLMLPLPRPYVQVDETIPLPAARPGAPANLRHHVQPRPAKKKRVVQAAPRKRAAPAPAAPANTASSNPIAALFGRH
jgi:hypothetical protein